VGNHTALCFNIGLKDYSPSEKESLPVFDTDDNNKTMHCRQYEKTTCNAAETAGFHSPASQNT
jgi:hypothetical protein